MSVHTHKNFKLCWLPRSERLRHWSEQLPAAASAVSCWDQHKWWLSSHRPQFLPEGQTTNLPKVYFPSAECHWHTWQHSNVRTLLIIWPPTLGRKAHITDDLCLKLRYVGGDMKKRAKSRSQNLKRKRKKKMRIMKVIAHIGLGLHLPQQNNNWDL